MTGGLRSERVTHQPICYVFVCIGCDGLSESTRRDQVFCSGRCRQRSHRAPERLRALRECAERLDVSVAGIQHGAAAWRLCPTLAEAILAGHRKLDTEARREIYGAFMRVLWAQVRARAAS